MTGRTRVRLGVALAMCAIWLTALAAPASAGGTIRYVDDNIGATACHGTKIHKIQNAINVSSPFDIVYVCPGIYREQLTINVRGLTVQSLRFQRAHLKPPASPVFPALVQITANGAKLRGFKMDIPAGSIGPLATGTTTCENLEAAVVVLARRVGVWGNFIDAIGNNTLSGACGYDIGILFIGGLGEPQFGFTQLPTSKSTAKRNVIRDFKLAGILAEGPMAVRILRNDIRYVHRDDPATCVPVNTVRVVAELAFPCEPIESVGRNPLNGIISFSIGIGVADGVHADVARNTVFSTFDFALFDAQQIPLAGGILFLGAAPGSRITENVVTQAFIGVGVDSEFILVTAKTGLPPAQGGIDVTFNRANEGYVGFIIDSDGNYIYANRARLNLMGLGTFDGSDNQFIENDARYNFGFDCYDETTGTGTEGTANTWQGNLGNNNDPQEICMETGGPF